MTDETPTPEELDSMAQELVRLTGMTLSQEEKGDAHNRIKMFLALMEATRAYRVKTALDGGELEKSIEALYQKQEEIRKHNNKMGRIFK